MGFKQLKGEHQVRYDGGMTPDQTITDGAEPNSKLTAKMSVPGHLRPRRLILPACSCPLRSESDQIAERQRTDAKGHVWMAPSWQGELSTLAGLVGAAMCRCAAQQLNLEEVNRYPPA